MAVRSTITYNPFMMGKTRAHLRLYAQRAFLFAVPLLSFLNILYWPRNRYEWMLQEPHAADLTLCSLPLDPGASFSAAFALVPVALGLILGAAWAVQKRRPALLIMSILLLAFWFVRFFVPWCF
jgi:hypothetical protein